MSEKKIPSLSEIQAQLKNKKVEVLTPENKSEVKNIFYISFAILVFLYIYNNPFNFTSILGIIKFLQLLAILFVIGCIYKWHYFYEKFRSQTEKIEEIYKNKTVKK